MKSQEHLGRLLGLVPYLQARPGVRVSEAAEAFGISEVELVRDLESLWMCGLPGGLPDDLIDIDMSAVEAEGVIHLSNADYLSRPMRLTPDEALSLLVALQSLGHVVPAQAKPDVASATEKLKRMLGSDVPVEVSIEAGEAHVQEVVAAAISGRRRIQLRYHGVRRTSSPLLDPARVDVVGGFAYLSAWNVDAAAWRSYRLDRVEQVVETAEPAMDWGDPPAPGSWFNGAQTVTLRLRRGAQWVVEYFQTSAEELVGEDLLATLPVISLQWATSLVLQLGDLVDVLDPPELRQALREQAQGALAHYSSSD